MDTATTNARPRRGWRRWLWTAPLFAGVLLRLLCCLPGVGESAPVRGLFRAVSTPLGWLVARLPLSLTELVVVVLVPLSLLRVVYLAVRTAMHSAAHKRRLKRWGRVGCWAASVIVLLYMLLHGINYTRATAAELLGLETAPQTTAALGELTAALAARASQAREQVATDEQGYMVLSAGADAALRQAGEGYAALEDAYPFLWGGVDAAKPVRLSHWWSYTGITGMYFPLLAEANVNIDQPDSAIPFTAAHELAHTRGFAREDECNFFACLACFAHPSPDYRYAGYLQAYIYCANALRAHDPARADAAAERLSDGVRADMAQRSAYWAQFEGEVRTVSTAVNDRFIAWQGVEDGVLSYNRVVDLLLAYAAAQELP